MRNYERLLVDYLDGLDGLDGVDLIDEAIASLEEYFNNCPEWEIAKYRRVDAIAYLALKRVQERHERPVFTMKPMAADEIVSVVTGLQCVRDYASQNKLASMEKYASDAIDAIIRMNAALKEKE